MQIGLGIGLTMRLAGGVSPPFSLLDPFAMNTALDVSERTATGFKGVGMAAGSGDRKLVTWAVNWPVGTVLTFHVVTNGNLYCRFDDAADINLPGVVSILPTNPVPAGEYDVTYTVTATAAGLPFFGFIVASVTTFTISNFTVVMP